MYNWKLILKTQLIFVFIIQKCNLFCLFIGCLSNTDIKINSFIIILYNLVITVKKKKTVIFKID